MIKLFRQKRIDLINQNNIGKYLRYAGGEVILVVIGILIALQVNNYNQKRIATERQEKHLQLVAEEIESNLKELNRENKELSILLSNLIDISNIMQNEAMLDTLSEKQLSLNLAFLLAIDIELFYKNEALTEILSVGGLKEMKNDSIRYLLASWDAKVSEFRLQEKIVNAHHQKMEDFIIKHGSVKTIFDQSGLTATYKMKYAKVNKSNKKLLQYKEFENIILLLFAQTQSLQKNTYPKFEHEMKTLSRLIQSKLGTEI